MALKKMKKSGGFHFLTVQYHSQRFWTHKEIQNVTIGILKWFSSQRYERMSYSLRKLNNL